MYVWRLCLPNFMMLILFSFLCSNRMFQTLFILITQAKIVNTFLKDTAIKGQNKLLKNRVSVWRLLWLTVYINQTAVNTIRHI